MTYNDKAPKIRPVLQVHSPEELMAALRDSSSMPRRGTEYRSLPLLEVACAGGLIAYHGTHLSGLRFVQRTEEATGLPEGTHLASSTATPIYSAQLRSHENLGREDMGSLYTVRIGRGTVLDPYWRPFSIIPPDEAALACRESDGYAYTNAEHINYAHYYIWNPDRLTILNEERVDYPMHPRTT